MGFSIIITGLYIPARTYQVKADLQYGLLQVEQF
jgi:hypothetical protein